MQVLVNRLQQGIAAKEGHEDYINKRGLWRFGKRGEASESMESEPAANAKHDLESLILEYEIEKKVDELRELEKARLYHKSMSAGGLRN